MATERYIDVRALEPPEPLELALEMAYSLQPGEYLRMSHHREPFPLYRLLVQDGFRHCLYCGSDSPIEILIWRADDSAADIAVRDLVNPRV